ncbi:MAG: zinc finger Ran-binding domain-containing protein [Actinobacteria bacterium]|nr:zinc finger Ran-binding domain-containing protein [Actinomycetota bacterium]
MAEPGSETVADPAGPPAADPVPAGDTSRPSPATSSDGRLRRTEEGLDWRCPACETWNPIERHTCVSCGAAFTRAFARGDDEAATPEVTEPVAVGASLLLPGLGHVLLGRTPAGALRMILYVTWLLGGLVLLRAAAGSGQPVLPAIPLLLGAMVVLVASVIEVQRTVAGADTVLLTARITLWLVVAVLGALMLSFFAATMAVTP